MLRLTIAVNLGGSMLQAWNSAMIAWANFRDSMAKWFGPDVFKMRWVINSQKGGMIFLVPMLMWYHGNHSANGFAYWLAHGGYGLLWLIKDRQWPDAAWERKVSWFGAVSIWLTVLGPYCLPAYWLASSGLNQPLWACLAWLALTWSGAGLMLWSDAVKYTAKKKNPKPLVEVGPWCYSRNPNYWGELLCYLGLAGLSGHAASFAVIAWVWAVLMVPNLLRLRQHMRANYSSY